MGQALGYSGVDLRNYVKELKDEERVRRLEEREEKKTRTGRAGTGT